MQRSSRKAWLVLWLGLVGCSLATDFDRGKIDELDAGNLPDGGMGGIGGGMDAGPDGMASMDAQLDADAQPTIDGSQPETGPQPEAGGQCTGNSQCGANQLCCSGLCVNTAAATQCTACGQACAAGSANTCNNRECSCDNASACSGSTPYCVASTGGASSCVECADSTACEGRTDGKTQCIDNRCSACDPKDNSGCMGTTPICDATSRTCVKCTVGGNQCGGNTVCTSSGACGGCDDATDCATPTAPICDMAVSPTVCRGCMGDTECASQMPTRAWCANDGRCGVCKPVANMADPGCDIASPTPACRTNAAGQYQCRECNAASQCAPGRPNCRGGRCVECAPASGGQPAIACTDPTKPVCDGGVCRACAVATEASDCPAATPACTALGMCAVCRPGGPNACAGSVNTTCSLINTCVDCLGTEGCPNGQQCKPGVGGIASMCVDCTNNMGCSGMTSQCDAMSNTCVRCLPTTNAGCMPGQTCVMGTTPAMNRCVECTTNPPPTTQCPAINCKTASCMMGECRYDDAPVVSDNIDCTVDGCNAATGAPTHMPSNAFCAALPTNDAFACTVPTCNPTTGCSEVPNNALCDDMLDCTTDACVAGAGCQFTSTCVPPAACTEAMPADVCM